MVQNSIFHSRSVGNEASFRSNSNLYELVSRCRDRQRERVDRFSLLFPSERREIESLVWLHDEIRGKKWRRFFDLLGKEKSSLPQGTRINSIPRWIQKSVPRKYEIGEHKFGRIYGRPRTNVSTSGRVLPALGPPSTSESISQVLHPRPAKELSHHSTETFLLATRLSFLFLFLSFLFFSKFHRSLFLSCTFYFLVQNNIIIRYIFYLESEDLCLTGESCPIFVRTRFSLKYTSKDYYCITLRIFFFILFRQPRRLASHASSTITSFPSPRVEKFNRLPRICNTKEEVLAGKIDAKRSRARSLSRVLLVG